MMLAPVGSGTTRIGECLCTPYVKTTMIAAAILTSSFFVPYFFPSTLGEIVRVTGAVGSWFIFFNKHYPSNGS